MAVPVIESSTDITEGVNTNSFAVLKPTGLAVDDLLLCLLAKDDNVQAAPPPGWSQFHVAGVDVEICIMYKIADSTDAAATDFTFTGDNEQYVGRLYRISGVDTTTPMDVTDTTGQSGTTTSPQSASVLTVTADALAFTIAGMDAVVIPSTLDTAGWTVDLNAITNVGNGNAGVVIGTKTMATAGNTGAVDYTQAAAEAWAATQFAIRPTAGSGVTRALTGNAATSAVDTAGNTTDTAVTGTVATSAVDTVGVSIGATVAITGVAGTSAEGTLEYTKSGSVVLSGEVGTSAAGAVGYTESGQVGITGLAGVSAVGALTASAAASVELSGVASSTSVEAAAAETAIALSGEAGTSGVGAVSTGADAEAAITGNVVSSAVGTVSLGVTKALTGAASSAAEGNVTASISVSVQLSGVSGVSAAEPMASGVALDVNGVNSVSSIGTVNIAESGSVVLTGVSSSGEVGTAAAGVPIAGAAYTIVAGKQMIAIKADASFPIDLSVDNSGGVAGLTVVYSLRDPSNSASYLDFNDSTFKTTGWGAKTQPLSDYGGGFYGTNLDVAGITNFPAVKHATIEYNITGSVTAISSSTLTIAQTWDEARALTVGKFIGLN